MPLQSLKSRFLLGAAPWLAACVAHADGPDHPLLSRVAGMTQLSKEEQAFGAVQAQPVGKMSGGASSATFEGKVTRIEYGLLQGPPPGELTIYRNHLNAARGVVPLPVEPWPVTAPMG